jgi:hypothetical protein
MTRHGLRYKSEYRVWWNIKDRCCNPINARYSSYQGMLCAEWHDPVVFCAAVGKRPTLKHTLDRIDVTKGYEPGNVRWATAKVQCRNRTDNRQITYRGRTRPMVEWCERLNRDYLLVKSRIRNGWLDTKAIATPTNKPFAGTSFKRVS